MASRVFFVLGFGSFGAITALLSSLGTGDTFTWTTGAWGFVGAGLVAIAFLIRYRSPQSIWRNLRERPR